MCFSPPPAPVLLDRVLRRLVFSFWNLWAASIHIHNRSDRLNRLAASTRSIEIWPICLPKRAWTLGAGEGERELHLNERRPLIGCGPWRPAAGLLPPRPRPAQHAHNPHDTPPHPQTGTHRLHRTNMSILATLSVATSAGDLRRRSVSAAAASPADARRFNRALSQVRYSGTHRTPHNPATPPKSTHNHRAAPHWPRPSSGRWPTARTASAPSPRPWRRAAAVSCRTAAPRA